jgi:Fe-Mn family superoxide dismutase
MKIEHLLEREKIEANPLPYGYGDLAPVMSHKTVKYHYDVLTLKYFKKYNSTGDEYQKAGGFLHNLLWQNLQASTPNNEPDLPHINKHIKMHFGNFDKFKSAFVETALTLHGSGWICAMNDGKIRTIQNHKIVKGIILIQDLYEHAMIFDYENKTEGYLDNLWKIVNWNAVNARLMTKHEF